MAIESSGFWPLLAAVNFRDPVRQALPATCDRFEEARYFLKQAIFTPAADDALPEINWIVSAHLSAVIGIWDAARADFQRRGLKTSFAASNINREFFLPSGLDVPASERDPLAVNRAYRDLRNLRVHFGRPLVELRRHAQVQDMNEMVRKLNASPPARWYMRQISDEEHKLLSNPKLSIAERQRLNEFMARNPLTAFICQHLYVLAGAIIETGLNSVA